MFDSKPWYMSKTVWGALVAIIASFLGLWDMDIPASEQARIVDLLIQVAAGGGGLLALVGRFMATRRLG